MVVNHAIVDFWLHYRHQRDPFHERSRDSQPKWHCVEFDLCSIVENSDEEFSRTYVVPGWTGARMRHPVSEKLKQFVRPSLYRLMHRGRTMFDCPICGYHGPFKDKRVSHRPGTSRLNSKCPGCTATERHRMLSLVCDDVFCNWSPQGKSLLHFAPEPCLQSKLQRLFAVYHTADLFMPRVDFKEDLQQLTFADGSYDCVLISHVMSSVPDMHASVGELRRILKPGGLAIIAEAFTRDRTEEYGAPRGDFWREVGMDFCNVLNEHFSQVDLYMSDRFEQRYQLENQMRINGIPHDQYPEAIRVDGVGYKSVTAVCRAGHNQEGSYDA